MFGRRKQEQVAAAPPAEKVGGKNRPTPKRRHQEAQNRRPLVPKDRRAAARSSREAARVERLKARDAMITGDERYLPPRDRGPVRRFVRDYVDARRNIGEYFLLVALVVVMFTLVPDPTVQLVVTGLLWLTVLAAIVDGFVLARKLRRRIREKFGEEALQRGVVRYGLLRAFQMRRTRLPRPRVGRGEYPV